MVYRRPVLPSHCRYRSESEDNQNERFLAADNPCQPPLDPPLSSSAEDKAGLEPCTTVGLAVRDMVEYSCVLVQSQLPSARENRGEWHAVAVTRVEKEYILSNSTFDPARHLVSTSLLRHNDLSGCGNATHLIRLGRTPKDETYAAVKGANDHVMNGRGFPRGAKMCMTGSACRVKAEAEEARCLLLAGAFIERVAAGMMNLALPGCVTH